VERSSLSLQVDPQAGPPKEGLVRVDVNDRLEVGLKLDSIFGVSQRRVEEPSVDPCLEQQPLICENKATFQVSGGSNLRQLLLLAWTKKDHSGYFLLAIGAMSSTGRDPIESWRSSSFTAD
jgi:hypothetical protein